MASIYLRHRIWWVKFQHPSTRKIVRANLETHDPARADLMRRRLELEVALLAPHFQAVDLPPQLRQTATLPPIPTPINQAAGEPALLLPTHRLKERPAIDEAIRRYVDHIGHENASAHVASKISMM